MTAHMVPCLCCGKALENVHPSTPLQPDATVFRATGNYGSGVFDPMRGDQQLQVSVCDDCLASGAELGRVIFLAMPPPERQPAPVATIWHPEVGQ